MALTPEAERRIAGLHAEQDQNILQPNMQNTELQLDPFTPFTLTSNRLIQALARLIGWDELGDRWRFIRTNRFGELWVARGQYPLYLNDGGLAGDTSVTYTFGPVASGDVWVVHRAVAFTTNATDIIVLWYLSGGPVDLLLQKDFALATEEYSVLSGPLVLYPNYSLKVTLSGTAAGTVCSVYCYGERKKES
jgi:hypothetical protein